MVEQSIEQFAQSSAAEVAVGDTLVLSVGENVLPTMTIKAIRHRDGRQIISATTTEDGAQQPTSIVIGSNGYAAILFPFQAAIS